MDSKKVWVVEQGSYSDYSVVGVFTSKENADLVAAAINVRESYEPATVAAWPLDPAVDELRQGMKQYLVHMQRDGTVERCEPWDISTYEIGGSAHVWRRTQAPAYKGKGIPDCLNATVWAKNETHAVKVTNEIRARFIAEGQWD